jgi:hypothetical protein
MTQQLTEVIGSQSYTHEAQKRTARRSFMAYDDADTLPSSFVLADARRLVDANGHKIGSLFPGDASLRLRSMDFSPVSDRVGMFEVLLDYETGDPNEDDGGQFELGPVSQNVTTRVENIAVWRNNPDPESAAVGDDVSGTDVDGEDSAGEDVGGNSADTAGTPLSYPLPLLDLTLVENTETTPDFIHLSSLIGTRNDAIWGGAPIGTVAYKGSSSQYGRNGFYTVTHQFQADIVFKFKRQMATASPATGAPELADENTANENSAAAATAFDEDGEAPEGAGTTKKGAAKNVVWVQHWTRFSDFLDITEYDPFDDVGDAKT